MAGNSATPSEGAKDGPVGFIAGRSTGFGCAAAARLKATECRR